MQPNELFGSSESLNKFYTELYPLAEIAISKHANILLNHLVNETAKFAYVHREELKKLAMAYEVSLPPPKSEQNGALEAEARSKQADKGVSEKPLPKGQADVDATGEYNPHPNCC